MQISNSHTSKLTETRDTTTSIPKSPFVIGGCFTAYCVQSSRGVIPKFSSDPGASNAIYISQMSGKMNSKRSSSDDRLKRSRERNRIHARKTRQRKKEQMQNLQARADDLKEEQIRLKQAINEKQTANILLGLFSTSSDNDEGSSPGEDPEVEVLLRRPVEDIPDASRIPELPALILPGQHASKKLKASSAKESIDGNPDDGIDYELLGKDRSKCTPEELDRIRRERNRMHAKRTRDRKRLFTEAMEDLCRQLEDENKVLEQHLRTIDPDFHVSIEKPKTEPSLHSGTMTYVSAAPRSSPSKQNVTIGQLKTLLDAAVSFEHGMMRKRENWRSDVKEVSDDSSTSQDDVSEASVTKRRRLSGSEALPRSIPAV